MVFEKFTGIPHDGKNDKGHHDIGCGSKDVKEKIIEKAY
jgi:hypothetical protein